MSYEAIVCIQLSGSQSSFPLVFRVFVLGRLAPDVGLAPSAARRTVPPHPPPLQLEDPSLKPQPFPRFPLPPSPPPPPWLFLQCSGRGSQGWCVLGWRGGGGGP